MAVDFSNESNWVNVFDELIFGVGGNPIPKIIVPNTLGYRFLRIAANNQDARQSWRLGAYISLLVDEASPQVEVIQFRTPVNMPAIFAVPDYLTSYRVSAKPPVWFAEISLQVEGFTGFIPNPITSFNIGV